MPTVVRSSSLTILLESEWGLRLYSMGGDDRAVQLLTVVVERQYCKAYGTATAKTDLNRSLGHAEHGTMV